jgi:acetyl-CoA carboxylase biotin carboxyl carrier protein
MTKEIDLSVDAALVRGLAELLAETGLTEIEYAVGDRRIRVARNLVAAAAVAAPAAPATLAARPADSGAGPSPAIHPGAVKAPMVGTIYFSPEPDAPPFVRLGDSVSEGQVVLIIEAMKVMNQIRSPHAGKLTQILVADGAPVEYGEPLLVLE